MFEPSVYSGRRRALVAALASRGALDGLVAFPGNNDSPVNYPDNAYRFRQDSCFLYYFGLAEPGLAAAIDLGTGRATLYADALTIDDLVWTGPRPGVDEYRALCGADAVKPRSAFGTDLAAARGRCLFTPPYRADAAIELGEALGIAPGALSAAASNALVTSVVAQREIKEDRELADIERAVDVTIDMHRAVLAAARPGVTEAAMMAEAYRVAYAGGGMPAFPAIATTKGSVLHNHGYPGTLTSGGLFLLDAGAETVEGYAGDLTSTFPIGGRYDDRQRAVYDIVLRAGEACSSMMAPGVPYRDCHLAAARAIAEGLSGLGVMRGDVDEAVAAGAHSCFFPHGVGHQMGLDVHDMENLGEVNVGYDGQPKSAEFGLKSLRLAKPLKAGLVVTVEPGVYFIEGLIAAWKAEKRHASFINYAEAEQWLPVGGIRNEEDWVVVDGKGGGVGSGARRLGKPFDKSAAAMEGYRA
ncbi:MAG TPA: Xaa-Pro aminopeptidase [Spirochaetales bacterium]|nr:Xaa-Pro aminopeptidase [Spirochaetales bacterium]